MSILIYQRFEGLLGRSLQVDHTTIACFAAVRVLDHFAVALVAVGILAGKVDKPVPLAVPAYATSCLQANDQRKGK